MDIAFAGRIVLIAFLLLLLYSSGVPLTVVVIFGIILGAFILLRGTIYREVGGSLEKMLPFISKWPPWGKKLLVAIVFILVYLVFKQAVYEILKLFGMDVQGMLLNGLNQTGSIEGK
jgi:hypothetical protein